MKGSKAVATDPFDIPSIVSIALDTRNYCSVHVSCNRGIHAWKMRILRRDREGRTLCPGDEELACDQRKTLRRKPSQANKRMRARSVEGKSGLDGDRRSEGNCAPRHRQGMGREDDHRTKRRKHSRDSERSGERSEKRHLPFGAEELKNDDMESYRGPFEKYLLDRKQIKLEDLSSTEAYARFKSFVHKW